MPQAGLPIGRQLLVSKRARGMGRAQRNSSIGRKATTGLRLRRRRVARAMSYGPSASTHPTALWQPCLSSVVPRTQRSTIRGNRLTHHPGLRCAASRLRLLPFLRATRYALRPASVSGVRQWPAYRVRISSWPGTRNRTKPFTWSKPVTMSSREFLLPNPHASRSKAGEFFW